MDILHANRSAVRATVSSGSDSMAAGLLRSRRARKGVYRTNRALLGCVSKY